MACVVYFIFLSFSCVFCPKYFVLGNLFLFYLNKHSCAKIISCIFRNYSILEHTTYRIHVELTEKYPLSAPIQNPAGHKFRDGREVEVLLTRWLLTQNMEFQQLATGSSFRGMLSSLVMAGNVSESRG
jgi:hypothetical protein